MEEKVKRVLDKLATSDTNLAETQAEKTIGEAVLSLLHSGRSCDRPALLKWFELAIDESPKPGLRRQLLEAAQKALQAASPSTS